MINVEKCLKIFPNVYVSSDSEEILELAKKAGAKTILREKALCGDTPNIPVYQHALKFMRDIHGIIAVQANSPTLDPSIIMRVKDLISSGVSEVMTCHENRKIYGSVWGLSKNKLQNYIDPYNPNPQVMIIDRSVDIHTKEDYELALKEMLGL